MKGERNIDLEEIGMLAADAVLGPGRARAVQVRREPDFEDGFSYKFRFLVDRGDDSRARAQALTRLSMRLKHELEARGDTRFAFAVFPTAANWIDQPVA